jgi:hypothetical protein
MSETPSNDEPSAAGQQPSGWDSDITDGRKKDIWKSAYPPEARKGIWGEMIYLGIIFIACVIGIFCIIYKIYVEPYPCPCVGTIDERTLSGWNLFLGYLGAWIAGTLGGCSFSIKWMYHVVAKRLWHEDRRLWRICSPHLSGIVSLIMTFLVSSGVLHVFDTAFSERPVGVMAFSFLVGYFSDKALAKMAEVADTLFGAQKKDK